MGQVNTSVVNSSSVTQAINNVSVSVAQTCISDTGATQQIVINGNNNLIENLVATQLTGSTLQCFTSADNQTQIVTDLAATLTGQASVNAGFVFGLAANTSVVNQDSVQTAITNAMVSTIQGCAQQFNIEQSVIVNGDYNQLINSSLSQQGQAFAKCVFGSSNITGISNSIATDINGSANTSTSMLSDLITLLIIGGFIVGGGAIALKVLQGKQNQLQPGDKKKPNNRTNNRNNIKNSTRNMPQLSGSTPIIRSP